MEELACKACKREYDAKLESCPHCGYSAKSGGYFKNTSRLTDEEKEVALDTASTRIFFRSLCVFQPVMFYTTIIITIYRLNEFTIKNNTINYTLLLMAIPLFIMAVYYPQLRRKYRLYRYEFLSEFNNIHRLNIFGYVLIGIGGQMLIWEGFKHISNLFYMLISIAFMVGGGLLAFLGIKQILLKQKMFQQFAEQNVNHETD